MINILTDKQKESIIRRSKGIISDIIPDGIFYKIITIYGVYKTLLKSKRRLKNNTHSLCEDLKKQYSY